MTKPDKDTMFQNLPTDPEEMKQAMRRGFDEWLRTHTVEHKLLIKQAIQEWLDSQFAQFGKFSLYAGVSVVMAAVFYLYLTSKGFKI